MCSGLLCHICVLISLSSWFLICGLIQVSLVVFNFLIAVFLHFLVTAFGLELFSGTYPNKLLFLWCPLVVNYLLGRFHQVRCFFAWMWKQSRLLKRCTSWRS